MFIPFYFYRIILDYAHRCGGVVVSNDNYRDLYQESDAFKEIIENRYIIIFILFFLLEKSKICNVYNRMSNSKVL